MMWAMYGSCVTLGLGDQARATQRPNRGTNGVLTSAGNEDASAYETRG